MKRLVLLLAAVFVLISLCATRVCLYSGGDAQARSRVDLILHLFLSDS